MNRILVIRGGAIGDFILTLPAIKLLRDQFPRAHIEILGNTQIIVLAENRFYADMIRSLESRSLTSFFVEGAELPTALREFFRSFDLIISFISDPQNIFQNNLKRCSNKLLLFGSPKLNGHEHAAFQLARPLKQIGLHLQSPAATIYPAESDHEFAKLFLAPAGKHIIALHPGSGSESKNWPIENWKKLGEYFLSNGDSVMVIGGEADEERMRLLETTWKDRARFAKNLALPHLAALLEEASLFIGHDSGVSHIAAAVGAKSLLLFGQSDPAVWAPANENVSVLRAAQGDLRLLTLNKAIEAVGRLLSNTGPLRADAHRHQHI